MAYSFDCLIETEGFLKVGGIQVHIHCKSGNISETVQDRHCYYKPLIGSDI